MAKSKAGFVTEGREAYNHPLRVRGVITDTTMPLFGLGSSWQAKAFAEGWNAAHAESKAATGEPTAKVGDTRTNPDGSVSTLVEGAPGTVPAWLKRVAPCPPGNLPEFHACPPGGIPCPGPKSIKPFIHGLWHAWQGQTGVMLSHEKTKNLREFSNADSCINWLYMNDFKEAARALNAHVKGA